MLQVEQVLQLGVERFYRRLAASVEAPSPPRLKERSSSGAQAAMVLSLSRLAVARLSRLIGVGSRYFRAQAVPTGARSAIAFHRLAHRVAVVARIEQHVLGQDREVGQLVENRLLLRSTG